MRDTILRNSLFVQKQSLNLAAAKQLADAVTAAAAAAGSAIVVAVVDDGGNTLCLQRMDEAGIGCVDIAISKAKAAVHLRTETKAFEEGLNSGMTSLLTLGVVTFGGGVPVMVGSMLVGGVGVSGGSALTDAAAAKAGIAAVLGV